MDNRSKYKNYNYRPSQRKQEDIFMTLGESNISDDTKGTNHKRKTS